jgi:hypothetical protein
LARLPAEHPGIWGRLGNTGVRVKIQYYFLYEYEETTNNNHPSLLFRCVQCDFRVRCYW